MACDPGPRLHESLCKILHATLRVMVEKFGENVRRGVILNEYESLKGAPCRDKYYVFLFFLNALKFKKAKI
jgi:hypothetical protein